jgi:predicted  nucleic acid-binding Zn-ribbon protein
MGEKLCCPECDHSMDEEEWEKLSNEDNFVTCPQCGEEIDYDELLSED